MLSNLFRFRKSVAPELVTSKLLNEDTFYPAFLKDLKNCHSELIIESPFITNKRLIQLLPTLQKLKSRKVRIVINNRDPHEHDEGYHREDAHRAVAKLQHMGVHVLYTGGHHRKLVVVDRKVLYEGSHNVLSQNNSSEVMRRIDSEQLASQMIAFIGLDKYF
ncbi:MAG: phospholipase D-like domain-containing protein [Candidatus Saccharimonadales bacterium]